MHVRHAGRSRLGAAVLSVLLWLLMGSDTPAPAAVIASDQAAATLLARERTAALLARERTAAPPAQNGESHPQPTSTVAPMSGPQPGTPAVSQPQQNQGAGALGFGGALSALSPIHPDAATGPAPASFEPEDEPVPEVAVRIGDHGDFKRVAFVWPEAVAYDVAHQAEQVTVAFDRRGRIDFSKVEDQLGGRVLDAWPDDGDATGQVTLRVLPGAEIRSFAMKDGRVVVVDVVGGSAPEQERAAADSAAAAESAEEAIEALRRQLEQRDALIENLLARVEQLERVAALPEDQLDRVTAGRASTMPAASPLAAEQPPSGSTETPVSAPQPSSESAAPPVAAPQPPTEPAAPPPTQDNGSSSSGGQPGQLEVDEDEIDRALERTLVQTGVLLLPPGQAEVEPFFSYTRRETDASLVVFAQDGLSVGADVDIRRNEFVAGQTLRFGMPFDSQLEFGFPYRLVDQSVVASVNNGRPDEVDDVGHGMGDISIGVAKTLLREDGHWWPDLVGRITWDSATGKTSSHGVALGGGFNELSASLSAVKRQDPLAFIGGVSYETTFEKDNVKPGDQIGFTLGAVLAASPATSLRLALDQRFVAEAESDGERIPGSDFVSATATFGGSVVLGRGILLDVAADIGLTEDAPDYAARVALPIRFNLPEY